MANFEYEKKYIPQLFYILKIPTYLKVLLLLL